MLGETYNSKVSDKERLLGWGFKTHHLIEHPDGSVELNLETLQMDWSLTVLHMMVDNQDPPR